jgi:hypothetical protein
MRLPLTQQKLRLSYAKGSAKPKFLRPSPARGRGYRPSNILIYGHMKKKPINPHIGSTFESFLREQGIFEEVTTAATKRVIAWRMTGLNKKKKTRLSKRPLI